MTKDSNNNELRTVETYAFILQLVPTDLDGTIQFEVEIVKNILHPIPIAKIVSVEKMRGHRSQ